MSLKKSLRRFLTNRIIQPAIGPSLLTEAAVVQQIAAVFPHDGAESSYTLPAYPDAARLHPNSPFPIPPDQFWAHYCTSVETYLSSGLDDTAIMRRLLSESGAPIEGLGRILELGVAGGRLIRNLSDLAANQQIWGVDIWASAVLWCQEHLSPPFHFATTTVTPHLPFEDRSFGVTIQVRNLVKIRLEPTRSCVY